MKKYFFILSTFLLFTCGISNFSSEAFRGPDDLIVGHSMGVENK